MASQYGWTIKQFISHTARQLQLIMKPLGIRIHNDQAFQVNLNGGKAQYKDQEIDKTFDWVKAQQNKHGDSGDKLEREIKGLGNG